MAGTWMNLSGTCRGVYSRRSRALISPMMSSSQREPVGELDEHRHEEEPARQVQVDHDRVVDLADAFKDVVDLGGADPHAEAVERGV